MFNVTQNRFAFKPSKDRVKRILFLHEKGLKFDDIARDSEVVDMSGGFILTRERVRQIIKREKQKTTD